jgi:hypothetical protein
MNFFRPFSGLGAGILQSLDLRPDIFLGFAKFVLETADEFVVLALGERKVVVGQLPVLLFEFALNLVPVSFQF